MSRLAIPDAGERDDLATLVGRAVQLDGAVPVRLKASGDVVEAFAPTPFDALLTGAVAGSLVPGDVTVTGSELLAALAVAGGPSVDPGTPVDQRWRGPVPAGTAWAPAGVVPGADVDAAACRGTAALQEAGHASAAVLDETALTRGDLRVPMRCVLALSGAGLLDDGADLRVATGDGWLRLDAPAGAVVRRRLNPLALAM